MVQILNRNIVADISKKAAFVTCAVCFVGALTSDRARAFSTAHGFDNAMQSKFTHDARIAPHDTTRENSPSSAASDACLSLLKAKSLNAPKSVADRNRRTAGKAAALGLVLGVRFALSPPEDIQAKTNKPLNMARFDVWMPHDDTLSNDRSALAISAYRHCQKEKALEALNGYRWSR